MSYTKILNTALWWSVTLLVSSFYIYASDINGKYLMMILTAIIAGLCVLRYGKKPNLHLTMFHVSILAFANFCLMSTMWSITPQLTLDKAMTILQILICMSVVYIYADHQTSILPLLDSIRWAGYLMALYLLIVYGWDHLKILLQDHGRLTSELVNSNSVGRILALSIILTLFRWIFYKFSFWYILVIPNIFLFAVANSKIAFLILILGLSGVLYIKYAKRNVINIVGAGIIGICGLIILVMIILYLPIFAGLKDRLEHLLALFTGQGIVDNSSLERSIMVRIGMEQFWHTPLLGLGIGSSFELTLHTLGQATYLHNNYVELLACGGLVGLSTYYWMFIFPGIHLFQRQSINDINSKMSLLLIFLLLIADIGTISYYSKQTYFFILIFFIQLKLSSLKGKNNVPQN